MPFMPTMNVSLTEDMVRFVEAEVSSGDYVSASEVVRDALRVMRHDRLLEETKLRLLREEIGRGIEAADSGAFSDRSVSDILQDVLDRQRK
jgi:antitoxin ParD1/3/4